MLQLRDYQKESIDKMNALKVGAYLINLATGLGKTFIFTYYINNLPDNVRVLILSHHQELVTQPVKYLTCSYGIEMNTHKSTGNEKVVSACVASISRRLDTFNPDDFDIIITDECHHSPAESYQKIYNYFNYKLHFGFTATPNRADCIRLDKTFDKIIIEKDLKFGIMSGYLSNIMCKRFYIDYDLKKCNTSNGDYTVKSLDSILNTDENAEAIAKIYRENAIGATLIFGVNVAHCEEIHKHIPDSIVITAKTKNRDKIIEDFTNGKIKCIINCMVLTEGTDVPRVNTVIIARPTKNISLYTQMVGRGLRLHPSKEELLLIDCVGVSDMPLCTASSLVGVDYVAKDVTPMTQDQDIQGHLFDLPEIIAKKLDTLDNWKINWKTVQLWAKGKQYQLHGVNYYQLPDGRMTLKFKTKENKVVNIDINPPDELGNVFYNKREWKYQELLDSIYKRLYDNYQDYKFIWNFDIVKKWGNNPATDKQISIIQRMFPTIDTNNLTKLEAMQIMNRMFNK